MFFFIFLYFNIPNINCKFLLKLLICVYTIYGIHPYRLHRNKKTHRVAHSKTRGVVGSVKLLYDFRIRLIPDSRCSTNPTFLNTRISSLFRGILPTIAPDQNFFSSSYLQINLLRPSYILLWR